MLEYAFLLFLLIIAHEVLGQEIVINFLLVVHLINTCNSLVEGWLYTCDFSKVNQMFSISFQHFRASFRLKNHQLPPCNGIHTHHPNFFPPAFLLFALCLLFDDIVIATSLLQVQTALWCKDCKLHF